MIIPVNPSQNILDQFTQALDIERGSPTARKNKRGEMWVHWDLCQYDRYIGHVVMLNDQNTRFIVFMRCPCIDAKATEWRLDETTHTLRPHLYG